MLTKSDIDEIDALISSGWSLVGPSVLVSGWRLQHGKPGAGGNTKRIHAAVAKQKSKQMKRINAYRLEFMGWK